jgi:hypothetical protein
MELPLLYGMWVDKVEFDRYGDITIRTLKVCVLYELIDDMYINML